jgi:hypothetical protein
MNNLYSNTNDIFLDNFQIHNWIEWILSASFTPPSEGPTQTDQKFKKHVPEDLNSESVPFVHLVIISMHGNLHPLESSAVLLLWTVWLFINDYDLIINIDAWIFILLNQDRWWTIGWFIIKKKHENSRETSSPRMCFRMHGSAN